MALAWALLIPLQSWLNSQTSDHWEASLVQSGYCFPNVDTAIWPHVGLCCREDW